MGKSLCLYHVVSECQTYSHHLSHMASPPTGSHQITPNLQINYSVI